jgi:hypothetical protein
MDQLQDGQRGRSITMMRIIDVAQRFCSQFGMCSSPQENELVIEASGASSYSSQKLFVVTTDVMRNRTTKRKENQCVT